MNYDRELSLFRTFGEGTILYVVMMRSGYSSRIFDIKSVPIPEPVPPPNEWVSWNPCRQSQLSASFLNENFFLKINYFILIRKIFFITLI